VEESLFFPLAMGFDKVNSAIKDLQNILLATGIMPGVTGVSLSGHKQCQYQIDDNLPFGMHLEFRFLLFVTKMFLKLNFGGVCNFLLRSQTCAGKCARIAFFLPELS